VKVFNIDSFRITEKLLLFKFSKINNNHIDSINNIFNIRLNDQIFNLPENKYLIYYQVCFVFLDENWDNTIQQIILLDIYNIIVYYTPQSESMLDKVIHKYSNISYNLLFKQFI
jgi:hypothetical protein